MRVPNKFDRCSICLQPKPLTWEHIIPESIGGTLESDIQCDDCNKRLGAKLVSKAKQAPIIRLAIRNLKGELPELYKSIEKAQRYTAIDDQGRSITARFKNGRVQVEHQKNEDGSLIFDMQQGNKKIREILVKDGISFQEIGQATQEWESAPDGEQIPLSKSRFATKGKVESYFPLLDAPEMEARLIVLLAYNYLCLLLGDLIFDNRLDFMRSFITNNEPSPRIRVETFTTRKYECVHKLFPEADGNETRINIILFGWLVYVVHILGIVYKGQDIVYVENLKNKRCLFAPSLKAAKNGEFYSTKGV